MSLENTLRVLRDTLLYRSFFHVFSIRGIYNFVFSLPDGLSVLLLNLGFNTRTKNSESHEGFSC